MVDRDGTLVRIVDVQQALEGRGYNGDGRLTFALSDDLCPWNTGTWELSAEGGAGRVKRSGADPALCLTPRALAILASGHLLATTLVHAGIIPSADAQALRTADAIFRTAYAPFCPDGF
jgi:predicted acetyltransferase